MLFSCQKRCEYTAMWGTEPHISPGVWLPLLWHEVVPLPLSFTASVICSAGDEQSMLHGSGAQQAPALQPDPPETRKSSSVRNPGTLGLCRNLCSGLPFQALPLLSYLPLHLAGGWHWLQPSCWTGQPISYLPFVFSIKAITGRKWDLSSSLA